MKPLSISASFKEDIYSYLYIKEGESFLDKSWQGLSDPTISTIAVGSELSEKSVSDYEKIVQSEEAKSGQLLTQKTPFNQYCINNVNREEIAIYLGLIWRLSRDFTKFGIPSYYRDTTAKILNKNSEDVLWEYMIDCEDSYHDKGFQFGNSWSNTKNSVIDGAGLFEINTFQEFVLMQNSVQRDASSNINLFCLESASRKTELTQALKERKIPELKNILRKNEIFIDLAIGSDPGYCDVLLIKSMNDIEGQISKIVKEYNSSVVDYEKSVDKFKTLDQFLTAIAKMINIYPN